MKGHKGRGRPRKDLLSDSLSRISNSGNDHSKQICDATFAAAVVSADSTSSNDTEMPSSAIPPVGNSNGSNGSKPNVGRLGRLRKVPKMYHDSASHNSTSATSAAASATTVSAGIAVTQSSSCSRGGAGERICSCLICGTAAAVGSGQATRMCCFPNCYSVYHELCLLPSAQSLLFIDHKGGLRNGEGWVCPRHACVICGTTDNNSTPSAIRGIKGTLSKNKKSSLYIGAAAADPIFTDMNADDSFYTAAPIYRPGSSVAPRYSTSIKRPLLKCSSCPLAMCLACDAQVSPPLGAFSSGDTIDAACCLNCTGGDDRVDTARRLERAWLRMASIPHAWPFLRPLLPITGKTAAHCASSNNSSSDGPVVDLLSVLSKVRGLSYTSPEPFLSDLSRLRDSLADALAGQDSGPLIVSAFESAIATATAFIDQGTSSTSQRSSDARSPLRNLWRNELLSNNAFYGAPDGNGGFSLEPKSLRYWASHISLIKPATLATAQDGSNVLSGCAELHDLLTTVDSAKQHVVHGIADYSAAQLQRAAGELESRLLDGSFDREGVTLVESEYCDATSAWAKHNNVRNDSIIISYFYHYIICVYVHRAMMMTRGCSQATTRF